MNMDELEFRRLVKYVAEKSGLSEEEVLERVNKYIQEMSGLIKLDGALYLVASDLNVELPMPGSPVHETIQIGKLVPGMRRAVVEGRIVKMYGVIKYVNKSGEPSERLEFRIEDETGEAVVVIWSKSMVDSLRDKLKEGDVIRIINARVSHSYGELSLHVDSSGEVELIRSSQGYPLVNERVYTVSNIPMKHGEEVDVKGRVVRMFEPSTFERQDGSLGRRSSFLLGDDESSIRVVLWGSQADNVTKLKVGSQVLIRNARVVIRDFGIELHSSPRTKIEVLGETEDLYHEFKVLYRFEPEVLSVKKLVYMDLLVQSDSKRSILRVWGEDMVSKLSSALLPAIIRVKGTYSRDGILHLGKSGSLELVEEGVGELPEGIARLARQVKYKRSWIGESSDGYREFRGTITWVSERARISWYCPNCGSRVEYEYDRFFCPNCGEIEDAEPLLGFSFMIDDGTGVARVQVYGRRAELLLGAKTLEVIEKANEYGEEDFSIPLDFLSQELVGKEVVVRGKAAYLETGMVRVILDEMEDADLREEAEKLADEIERIWLNVER